MSVTLFVPITSISSVHVSKSQEEPSSPVLQGAIELVIQVKTTTVHNSHTYPTPVQSPDEMVAFAPEGN
jgi:hypothetical protein